MKPAPPSRKTTLLSYNSNFTTDHKMRQSRNGEKAELLKFAFLLKRSYNAHKGEKGKNGAFSFYIYSMEAEIMASNTKWTRTKVKVRMSIDVTKELHQLIKYTAAFEKQSIKDFVIEAIRDRLKEKVEAQQQALAAQYKELSALTRLTLEKSDRGEELETYESVDAFFK